MKETNYTNKRSVKFYGEERKELTGHPAQTKTKQLFTWQCGEHTHTQKKKMKKRDVGNQSNRTKVNRVKEELLLALRS